MPRQTNDNWPGVHTEPIDGILDGIKITSNASAGAPYWRNKGECMDDILEVGLPLCIKAIKEGKLKELWHQNPELFLCEVKNKMDRYEVTKLSDKTRPYVCVPAHWAFLFSCMTQGFQQTLWVFEQDGAPANCSNAYGFSSVNGGLSRFVDWMHKTPRRRGQVVCYGDDACITFWKNGKLYRVDPDFKQMDGSLNRKDIKLTIDWILKHLTADAGEKEIPKFWQTVANVWLDMATNPRFLLDGSQVYVKKQPHGLMTGVPGTTLFDTVKSVLAWNRLLDKATLGEVDLLDEKSITKWMAQQGLVVKEGTWKPVELPPRDKLGLVTDHKFLGVQILQIEHKGKIVCVPTVPEEDALDMLLCQKDNPHKKEVSRFAAHRTLYDRMRGLMITFGFTKNSIREAIHNVVNDIPGSVIVMQTQEMTGAGPEHITLQDFQYPDSSGFPSYDFCVDLYAEGTEREGWIQLFPTLTHALEDFKRVEKRQKREYNLTVERGREGPRITAVPPPEEPPLNKEYQTFETLQSSKVTLDTAPSARSKIIKVTPDGIEEGQKYLPNLGQTIRLYLESVGGISQFDVVKEKCGITSNRILRDSATRHGVFLTGTTPGDLVSLFPIISPFPTCQEAQVQEMKESSDLVNKGTTARKQALRAPALKTQPNIVHLDTKRLTGQVMNIGPVKDENEALSLLNNYCSRHFSSARFLTLPVHPWEENPVGVQLRTLPQTPGQEDVLLAEAWSASAKLAKEYIAFSFLELNDIPLTQPQHFGLVEDPPLPGATWAQEVQYETSPQAKPEIQDLHEEIDWDAIAQLKRENPDVSINSLRSLVSSAQSAGGNYVQRIRNILELRRQKQISPDKPPSSKRSKFTQEKRTRLNRKTLERRKLRAKQSP